LAPVQMWAGMSPSPVVSDERSPQTQMRACRSELYQAALRTHTQQVHETCSPSGRTRTVHRATIVPQV
jgi:hypothetical protein